MTIKTYLLSLPERLLRSGLGLGAGVAREVGQVALPDGVKRSRLYQNLVDTTLRFLIEQVGGVEGAYAAEDPLPHDFLKRRTAGNVVEALGLVAFRTSPVWVLAALADVCGMGRQLIPEIADALKDQGLLEKETTFTSVDQILDGLERTSSRLATTINTPPLEVAGDSRGVPGSSHARAALARDVDRHVGPATGRGGTAEAIRLRDLDHARPVRREGAARRRPVVVRVGDGWRVAHGSDRGDRAVRSLSNDARGDPAGWLRDVRCTAARSVRAGCSQPVLARTSHVDRALPRPWRRVFRRT